ncbi:Glycerol-3-phosphate dehydrogenase [NAD(P)+] [Acetobacteraceae bacterium EV16G]|uniref:Glycerol-3-phosphate dehydrogenase [NAD(P)+] n=1 Tax=Sorlinia euscelidii TaxID=3081148 RepID=A0ABU7U4K1_9PROT
MSALRHIAIFGAGAWGIALAQNFARAGHKVTLWSRSPVDAASRRLPRLPHVALLPAVHVTNVMPEGADDTLFATPTHALRDIARVTSGRGPVIACCKGLERDTYAFPADILRATCPGRDVAILSGPNFAGEIATGLPAAATLAASHLSMAEEIASRLATPRFRLYASDDLTGVQLAGAAKNVIAIAAGIAIGAQLGENARAALMTRGLAEMHRLNRALGGQAKTLSGLSGMGDLILTCTGPSSRNFRFGLALGQNADARALALDETHGIVEGCRTAPVLLKLARRHAIDMPLVETVSKLIAGDMSVTAAKAALMSRPLATE